MLAVLVLEDFLMAAYLPLLVVIAAGESWREAVVAVSIALLAVAAAFVGSYRWGHRMGRMLSHSDPEQFLLRVLGLTLVVAALAEVVHVIVLAVVGPLLARYAGTFASGSGTNTPGQPAR